MPKARGAVLATLGAVLPIAAAITPNAALAVQNGGSRMDAGDVTEVTSPAEPNVPAAVAEAAEPEPAAPGIAVPGDETGSTSSGSLLAPSDAPAPAPVRPVAPPASHLLARDATTEYYAALFRPKHNPTRFAGVARMMYSAISSQNGGASGRFGGLAVDAGATWNHVGVGVTGNVLGGEMILPGGDQAVLFMAGGGPTAGLGRLALLRQSFFDIKLGYDFLAAPTLSLEQSVPRETLLLHGPRVRIDMGLLAHSQQRRSRFWQGAGVTFGYRAFVGSAGMELPTLHVLEMGLLYWLG